MTEEEWLTSDDAIAMLEALRDHWQGEEDELVRIIHRYLLACCRAIWALLPMEETRLGVEVAERYIEGRATREEFAHAEYQAEGAAFFLEPFEWPPIDDAPDEPEVIRELYDRVRREREEEAPEIKQARRQYEADRTARIEPLVKDVEAIPVAEMRRMVRATAGAGNVPPRQLLADAAYFADFAMVYPGVRPREGAIERYSQFLSATLLRELIGSPFR